MNPTELVKETKKYCNSRSCRNCKYKNIKGCMIHIAYKILDDKGFIKYKPESYGELYCINNTDSTFLGKAILKIH